MALWSKVAQLNIIPPTPLRYDTDLRRASILITSYCRLGMRSIVTIAEMEDFRVFTTADYFVAIMEKYCQHTIGTRTKSIRHRLCFHD